MLSGTRLRLLTTIKQKQDGACIMLATVSNYMVLTPSLQDSARQLKM